MDEDNFAAIPLETDLHPPQRVDRARDRLMPVERGIEHDEPAGAGAKQLTARSPGLARLEIPVVNRTGSNTGSERFLEPPTLVQDLAERRKPIELQLAPQVAREVRHAASDLLLFLLCRQGASLAPQNVRRAAG